MEVNKMLVDERAKNISELNVPDSNPGLTLDIQTDE
jgi:hypothetical protein